MKRVTLKIDGAITAGPDCPARAHTLLRKALSVSNPEYHRRAGQGLWTGDIDERVHAARETPEGLVMPRGAVSKIKSAMRAAEIEIVWDDRRVKGNSIEVGALRVKPRPFQTEAIEALGKKKQGLVVLACGGGKTTIGLGCIAQAKTRTLVLVHTEELLHQWQDEIKLKLGSESGSIAAGKVKLAGITVAMIQTMKNAVESAEVQDWLAGCGLCILDECHHAPAASFLRVLESVPARLRVGLTATPTRGDGLGKFVDWAFGPRFIELTTKDLLGMGFLMLPELEVVATDFEATPSGTVDPRMRSTEIQGELALDQSRLHQIASLASAEFKLGHTVLLLANREAYCRALGKLCWARGAEPIVVTGKTTKSVRKAAIARFKSGEERFLIATSLANEGLDAPRLSRIIFAWPDSSRSATEQKVGRLMRLYDKKPKLIDVVDVRVPQLVNRYKKRAVAYRAIGMKTPKPEEIL